MFKGVELVLVTRQKIIVLPKAEPTVASVHVAVRARYSEPKLNQ
jgi:hypothetical protein